MKHTLTPNDVLQFQHEYLRTPFELEEKGVPDHAYFEVNSTESLDVTLRRAEIVTGHDMNMLIWTCDFISHLPRGNEAIFRYSESAHGVGNMSGSSSGIYQLNAAVKGRHYEHMYESPARAIKALVGFARGTRWHNPFDLVKITPCGYDLLKDGVSNG